MHNRMTEGSPLKLILMFAMPVLLGNVFQQFYNMADTMMVVYLVMVVEHGQIRFFLPVPEA